VTQPDGETRIIEDFETLLGRELSVSLFKLILVHPERRVKRDVLVRTMWPGRSLVSVRHSLEVTKSKLARKLEDLCGRSLLPRVIGDPPIYATASQEVLWTDLSACEGAIGQALISKDPVTALSHWEQAYAFMQRGELLADDSRAHWYEASLIQDCCARLSKQRRQCVLRIADLSLECGDTRRAQEVLTEECEAHPADEDLAFYAMNVLVRLGQHSEALARYTQLEVTLSEQGREPADVTKRLALWLRDASVTKHSSSWSSLHLTQEYATYESLSPFSQTVTHGIIEVSGSKPVVQNGAPGLPVTDQNRMQQSTTAGTYEEHVPIFLSTEQVTLLLSLVTGDDIMTFDPSKRDALRSIAATILTASHTAGIAPFAISDPEPWERLSRAKFASSPSTVLNAATLEHFQQLLTTSWQLCDGNQFVAAEGVLVAFLPQLLSLPKQEPDTAFLVSNALRLQSIFAHHHLRLSEKVRLCELSVSYASLAEDANTLVTALIELAWAHKYAGLPYSLQKRLVILQEALNQSHQASPLVQARIYSEYSLVLAESGRLREAECYSGLAQQVFPDDPASDPGFVFADSNMFDISYCAGFVCIHAGAMAQAFPAFELYKQHPSGLVIPERFRLVIANGQSQAAILNNDAERYAGLLEDVLVGSVRIGSQKRFDEALGIFQEEMPASWLLVQRIKELVEQYGLKREKSKS